MKTVVLTVILLLAGVLLLGVKVFFVKGGRFPQAHAHEIMNRARKNSKHTPDTNRR